MMNIYDQHVHTFLSYDCDESFEAHIALALEKGCTHFVTTDHLDLSCCITGCDVVPDFAKQDELLQDLQKKYPLTFLKGVEISYKKSRLQDCLDIIQRENFDIIVMGVHEDEYADCTTAGFLKNMTPDEAYAAYLDLTIEMLSTCQCYDIVAHVDYLLRYIDPVHIEKHEEKLGRIFQLIIEHDKVLECNTRFLYQHDNNTYIRYIFEKYYACGGRKVCLGSDAHTTKAFMGGFEQATAILKNIGFTHAVTFQKRKEHLVPLA